MMQEDKLLVQQTITGDEQAFHRLIMRYYTAIYAFILSSIKDPEDAKDLTQEVFLEAYQGLASLRQPEQFNFWLKKIAKYHCQDWLRKRREPYLELSEDMISDAPSIDETLILRETLAKVMKAIDELPETESQLLKERYLDDASYDDLEAKHGLSQSALAMRLSRAKQHVREKIKLLSGVFALSWQDLAKKIFVGGVEAVKIGVKTKLIIGGIVGILILGGIGVFINRHNVHNESEQTVSQISQKVNSKSPIKQVSRESKSLIGNNNPIDKKVASEKKQMDETFAWLDSSKDSNMIQPTPDNKQNKTAIESRKEIYNGMTREEVETALAEVNKEIYKNLYTWGSLYSEVMEITQGRKTCPPDTTAKEMWDEADQAFRYAALIRATKQYPYALALGLDPREPFRSGGWAYELIKHTSRRLGVERLDDLQD